MACGSRATQVSVTRSGRCERGYDGIDDIDDIDQKEGVGSRTKQSEALTVVKLRYAVI
jgi:hypothetical protein